MSVWKSVSYRDDALQFVGRHLPLEGYFDGTILKAAHFETDFEGELTPDVTLKPGCVADQFRDNPLRISCIVSGARSKQSFSLHKTLLEHGNITHGLPACFKVIGLAWDKIWEYKPEEQRNLSMESQMYAVGMAGGYHSVGDVDIRLAQLSKSFQVNGEGPETFIKELHMCAAAHKRRGFSVETRIMEAAMKPLPPVPNHLGIFLPGWEVYTFRGVLLLTHIVTGEVLLLMQKDLDRIEKFVNGAASARLYARMYGALPAEKRRILFEAVVKWQNAAVDCMRTTSDTNSVCRAFDIIYFIHLADAASDVSKFSYNLQLKKYQDGEFSKIIDMHKVLRCVSGLAFKERLEVLQQYKLFPAPDFDSYCQADRQRDLYKQYSQMHSGAINSHHFHNILLYHRWLMTVAFHARHGFCPGFVKDEGTDLAWAASYPYTDPKRIPFRESCHIDFNGDFTFNGRRSDCFDLVKDKAICPVGIDGVRNAEGMWKIPAKRRTQLLDVLSRDHMPDLEELAEHPDQLYYDVKADDKPEAKKPHGRWFFEAHSDVRLLLSEYEDSNADYARYFPGSVVGLNANDVKKRVNAASAPMVQVGPDLPLYISFDIEKFSPAFHYTVSQKLDAMWAEAYGRPHIADSSQVLIKGKIHYVKPGFHHVVEKQGADFEGFFGRRNTMYHCALMGYTVNTLRADGLIQKGAHFATLIDDGLLRLVCNPKAVNDFYTVLANRIEEIYRCGSMQISWDKTFMSHRISVFLNEVRFMGRSITPGMKAVLRIDGMADTICPNILSDLELVASTTRGAITSGATPSATYAVYCVIACKTIRRWGKYSKGVLAQGVLKSFLPARVGGLSVCGLMSLAGSLVHDDLAESLGILRIAGFRYQKFQNAINSLVSLQVQELGGDLRFSNPHGVTLEGKTVRKDRGSARIKRYLLSHANLPAIDHYLMAVKGGTDAKAYSLPSVPTRFPCELRERIWASTPEHVIEGLVNKFLKARSALTFVPFRILYRATIANKSEAKIVVKAIFG